MAHRLSAGRSEGGAQVDVLEGEIPLMKRATNLGIQMRHIANKELGVTHMQVRTVEFSVYYDFLHITDLLFKIWYLTKVPDIYHLKIVTAYFRAFGDLVHEIPLNVL